MSFTRELENSTHKSDLAIVAVLVVKICKRGKPKSLHSEVLKIDKSQVEAWEVYSADGVGYYLLPNRKCLICKRGNRYITAINADDELLADMRSKLGYLASQIAESDNQMSKARANKPEKMRKTHSR
jgi:hypothetical protein